MPLLFALMSIFTIALTAYNLSERALMEQMERNGVYLTQLLSRKIEGEIVHYHERNELIEKNLLVAGKAVLAVEDQLSDKQLSNIRDLFGVHEIYWYSPEGEILYSASGNYISWTPNPGDPIDHFMSKHKHKDVYVEDIRKSTERDKYFKFAYLRNDDGSFVQVGYSIDQMNIKSEKNILQNIVERITDNEENILYALILDENFTAVADSDIDEIGVDYSEDEHYQVVLSGEVSSFEWYYPQIDDYVLEVAVPLFFEGKIIGVVGIGLSMEETKKNVTLLTLMFILLAIIISIGFFILQRKNVITPVKMLNKHIQLIDTERLGVNPLNPSDNKSFSGLYETINQLFSKLHENITQIHNLNEKVEEMAYTDYLTKLPNRISLSLKFDEFVGHNQMIAIILIDLDSFKEYNDTRGHLYGDQLLVKLSERLLSIKDDTTFVSRFGGDEFLLLIMWEDHAQLNAKLQKIEEMISQPIFITGEELSVEGSIGISLYPNDDKQLDGLISKADIAMYHAKKSGKNQSAFFSKALQNTILMKNKIHDILRNSLNNNGFKLLYQPQVDVSTGEIVGFEALIRLKDHQISPAEFIAVAEEHGLIKRMGRFVIRQTILELSKWKVVGLDLKPIAINFSVKQINDKGIIEYIESLLSEHRIPAKYLEIEITESILLENDSEAIMFLNRLKEIGVKIALDDFGTGYSSLSYLSNLPVDKMKLDKKFIDQHLNESGKKIIKQLILLAEAFELDVVVEGVETIEQVRLLQELKCKYIQGYYFSKPIEDEQIREIHSKKYDIS
ncbi:EAL domain-containing protein [Anaerobacillus isosaccharinicus]|uniref:EAL domain-containing protein n=1 Tax=Anaerobacillus isosaccharinicus TaxID=1532552 RepID=A0A7S7RAY9_9BACI|nr:EAL domain-containing protein [Anaerobacillus isosaccharinicus]MBA5586425.1 EAL domain-containing protein [Anaerobacillus isosaccharinicus]QOY35332.1 EAL domain-containing protein [Anaerobacillus isosaccharinicus]